MDFEPLHALFSHVRDAIGVSVAHQGSQSLHHVTVSSSKGVFLFMLLLSVCFLFSPSSFLLNFEYGITFRTAVGQTKIQLCEL